jgi:5-methylcytosine-specific restriction protein A
MTLLFCNIGWMEKYEGLKSGDKIKSGASYIRKHKRGGEICNFAAVNGFCYGHVQRRSIINIDRLGAARSDKSISGITVIWIAPRPNYGSVVVGWYKNATVFRHIQKFAKCLSGEFLNRMNRL